MNPKKVAKIARQAGRLAPEFIAQYAEGLAVLLPNMVADAHAMGRGKPLTEAEVELLKSCTSLPETELLTLGMFIGFRDITNVVSKGLSGREVVISPPQEIIRLAAKYNVDLKTIILK